MLGDLIGMRFLDLFAGSGAVGIEALSRGAQRVCFVESGGAALAALRANLRAIGTGMSAEVVPRSLPAAVDRLTGAFEVVFLDPPYAAGDLLTATVGRLLAGPLVSAGGVVVVEHASRHPLALPAGLVADTTRRVGDTAFTFGRPIDDAAD